MAPGSQAIASYAGIVIESGQGSEIRDVDGNTFLDFAAGICVSALGYGHERHVTALSRQLAKVHVGSFTTQTRVEALEAISAILPAGLDRIQLYSGGSEAVESAIRLARARRTHATAANRRGSSPGVRRALRSTEEIRGRSFGNGLPNHLMVCEGRDWATLTFPGERMMGAMRRVFRAGVCVVVFSACGGSDGTPADQAHGGAGGGGTASGAFVITPAALTFTAVQNGQLPAPQSIHIHRDDTKATFGSSWANYGNAPGWLEETSFARVDTTASDFDLDFAVTTTNLTPGTYSTSYDTQLAKSVYCAPTGGPCIPVDLIGKKTIPITYVVTTP